MTNRCADGVSSSSHRGVVVAYDRLCTFEYGIAAEVFGFYHPGLEGDWYQFQTAAAEEGRLRTNTGLVVEADGGLELLQGADRSLYRAGAGHASCRRHCRLHCQQLTGTAAASCRSVAEPMHWRNPVFCQGAEQQ